ncbi:MAG: bifunctional 5,10-methylenetetrahydrofolate dehydrogenase/5,10-methenyltetrahydrofolate cyclohydrolase [Candidatus Paceibacterota bacterium]|jgi:methylenetetrahydrofolate dehydrogenase (NADP+)/methenyltetrahydrofolate cyclohydrolase
MQIIDGKKIRDEILKKVKAEVGALSFKPVFCDVLVGNDPASLQYVQMKGRMAESVGISFHEADFSASISTEDLIKEIKVLNKIENMCGIIIQLPLPEHIDRQVVLDAIDSHLDVDCLGTIASEKFYSGVSPVGFPTALACMALLDSLNLNFEGKKIVVLGRGLLVGKPVAALLQFRNLFPEIIRSKTENKEELIKQADIIISGIGKGKYITGNMIKKGAVLIDAGTSEDNGSLDARRSIVGDVDLESVKDVAEYVSPVPGGVGPVTVAMLLNNVLTVAKSFPLHQEKGKSPSPGVGEEGKHYE